MGPSTSASVPGATTNTPLGLLISLAILAISLDDATPTDAVSPPVRSAMSRRMSATVCSTVAGIEVGSGGQIDEGLVERERLDQRRSLTKPGHHEQARLAIGIEPATEECRMWAPGSRLGRTHRRPYAVHACLVGGGGNDTARADATDDDGLASQRRLVPLLDRGEEGIKVEMHDRSR